MRGMSRGTKLVLDCVWEQSTPHLQNLEGVTISDDETIASLIANGDYASANQNIISEKIGITFRGTRGLVLMHFPDIRTVTETVLNKALAELKRDHGGIGDLLAVGAHTEYRDLQRHFPILALSSSLIVNDKRMVFMLGMSADRLRIVEVIEYLTRWPAHCRFLIC